MGVGAQIGARIGAQIGARTGATRTFITTTTHSLSLTDSADPVITGGDAFSYSAVYTNTGIIPATSVQVQVTLDASLTYVLATGTGWSFAVAGQVVTCTRASVAAGAAPTITINVTTGGSAVAASTSAVATATNVTAPANATQGTTVNLVTKDATKGWYFPASGTEMSNLLARKGVSATVDSIYTCQEASGNLADTGATGGLPLVANGTPLYQQTVADTARKGVGFNGTAAQRFALASGTGPNPNTTSQTWIWFVSIPTNSVTSVVATISTAATSMDARLPTTISGKLRCQVAGTNADSANVYVGHGTFPLSLKYNRTGSEAKVFTDSEKLTDTYNAGVLDGFKGIGGGTTNAPTSMFAVWGCLLSGAHGELSDATLKAVIQAMGPTISWS